MTREPQSAVLETLQNTSVSPRLTLPLKTCETPNFKRMSSLASDNITQKIVSGELPIAHRALAAMAAVLYRYSGQDLLGLGWIKEDETRVLAVDFAAQPSFSHIHRQIEAAFQSPGASKHALQTDHPQAIRVALSGPDSAVDTHWDIHGLVSLEEEHIEVLWTYDANRIDPHYMAQLARHWVNLLGQGVENPDQKAAIAPMLTYEEQEKILNEWNHTEHPLPKQASIHRIFEGVAGRYPENVAVVWKNTRVTYRELNEKANQLAHYLLNRGVKPNTLVGLCMDRSPEMITCLLGILKAGAGYLPLDIKYPEKRQAHMIQDSGIALILTTRKMEDRLRGFSPQCIFVDEAPQSTQSTENTKVEGEREHLAYVNYTSGSTGNPKGVSICHKNVIRLVFGDNCVSLTSENRILQQATVCFDAATFEIWGALLHGARCVVFSETFPTLKKLGKTIADNQVTTLFITSAFFNLIIDEAPQTLVGVKQALVGGEALSPTHVRKALQMLPGTQIINGYGPTECTTFAAYKNLTEVPEGAATCPIGKPLSNTQAYILDNNLQIVAPGVVGELHLGGDGLALNYLNREDLTRSKFIKNLSFLSPETRLYKTGDLARCLPNGDIDILGRVDNQVKIHGFRIELGEIESALSEHEKVQQATVVIRNVAFNEKQIIAWVVTNGSPLEAEDLNTYLAHQLPAYMIPKAYRWLDALPLTPNGKVDRSKLTEMSNSEERG